jgi:hypothetical protein
MFSKNGVHVLRRLFVYILCRACATRSITVLGCLNVRSLLNQFDDNIELFRDRHIDLICLTESWHDADSAVFGRLRCAEFNVVHRPRPYTAGTDDISVNHGGIVVVSAANVVPRRAANHLRGGLRKPPSRWFAFVLLLGLSSLSSSSCTAPARWRFNKSSSTNSPSSWIGLRVTWSRSTLLVTSTSG